MRYCQSVCRLETAAVRKRQKGKLEVAELKILAFTLGLTNMEKIRNEYIRGKAQVEQL